MQSQIKDIGLAKAKEYISFIGTLFLFIAFSNMCIIFPWYEPPTGSLSTTAALAISVFLAVPFFGIQKSGVKGYMRSYLQPTVIMLPFNLISELSRTLALADKAFWQYHERRFDRGDSAWYLAFYISDGDEGAWIAYWNGAGLYFQCAGNRLYRRGG